MPDPFSVTHGEELIAIIEQNAPKQEDVIKEIYDSFDSRTMLEGVNYYFKESDIKQRKIMATDEGGNVVPDNDATNNKIASGFHKILVDQKVAYLSGEPMVFGSKSEDAKTLELIDELLGEEFEDVLPELIINVSNKGREWMHPYVNEDGDFEYMIVPAEEFIPLFDRKKKRKLVAGIRFYPISEDVIKFEMWTSKDVTYYEMIGDKLVLDVNEEVNPAPHFWQGTKAMNWGDVPFIEFANNEARISDLHFVKGEVDAYDRLVSDAQNTLEDMQSLIYVLKGYEGTNLAQFNTQLKRYKVISIAADEGAGVDTLKAEVPVEAYKTQSDKLMDNIYAFGQGVNPSPDIIGNAPSGVALKNLYSLLDMKASMLERKFTLSLRRFMWFVSEYAKFSKKGDFNYRDITFTFSKMLLTNEAEIIQMARDSDGVISKTTILENHPWVKDAELEKQRLEDDALLYGDSLEPLGGEGDGSTGDTEED
ncbi:SPP1 family phage portal protein [Psychrobacillus insolitus]|uniref:SPP1 family phage portal protein n=1 Tax=Psychrobacillus insolitus TaxID=1461 RepID=A0A2W7MVS6_9BACI|nr:phage portal protein [Psychrobacillus insolitus]PZX07911.1 SPP1 family phage portal protein [Psychrobacillus insolitus]